MSCGWQSESCGICHLYDVGKKGKKTWVEWATGFFHPYKSHPLNTETHLLKTIQRRNFQKGYENLISFGSLVFSGVQSHQRIIKETYPTHVGVQSRCLLWLPTFDSFGFITRLCIGPSSILELQVMAQQQPAVIPGTIKLKICSQSTRHSIRIGASI